MMLSGIGEINRSGLLSSGYGWVGIPALAMSEAAML